MSRHSGAASAHFVSVLPPPGPLGDPAAIRHLALLACGDAADHGGLEGARTMLDILGLLPYLKEEPQ